MEAAQELGELGSGENPVDNEQNVPKKQFLKRKKPAYVPPMKPQTKHYKYYSDAIAKKEGSTEESSEPGARNSRRATGGLQHSDDRRDQRRRIHTPNSGVQHSSGRQNSENHGEGQGNALDNSVPR